MRAMNPLLSGFRRQAIARAMSFRLSFADAVLALLEGETLGVNSVGQDYRVVTICDRAVHVRPEGDAVVRGNGPIPFDTHPVPHLTSRLYFRQLADMAQLQRSMRKYYSFPA